MWKKDKYFGPDTKSFYLFLALPTALICNISEFSAILNQLKPKSTKHSYK